MPTTPDMQRFSLFPILLLVGAAASLGAVVLHVAGSPALHPSIETSAGQGLATNSFPTTVTNSSPQAAVETPDASSEVAALLAEATATPEPPAEPDETSPDPAPAVATVAGVARLPDGIVRETPFISDAEKSAALLQKMNDARGNAGSEPLAADRALDEVALVRANDLIENGYFDHYSPSGENAFTELGLRGIAYRLAGENLARNNYPEARTVSAAFDGLMGSPGHRANVLEPRFTRAGVAVVRSGRVWYYVTVFAD